MIHDSLTPLDHYHEYVSAGNEHHRDSVQV